MSSSFPENVPENGNKLKLGGEKNNEVKWG